MGIFSKGKPARSEAPEFIEVGQIVNTHGVKGDVKVQPWDVTPAQLAGFKQPKDIVFVRFEELPRSTTGKIQRHEVEAWLKARTAT